jgi:YfiH family protein
MYVIPEIEPLLPPPVLTSSILTAAGFTHGFSTRKVENARELADAVHLDETRLFQAKQVHGDRVIAAGCDPSEEADALVATKGDAVAVRTADCVPILLANSKTGSVAAVHAGWRGVVNGIIGKAIAEVQPDLAAVGPHIGPCCFEVGADVAAQLGFVDRIDRGSGGVPRSFVNLRKAVHEQLRSVRNVDDVGDCTKCHPERWFSYRRDGAHAGRLYAVIRAR